MPVAKAQSTLADARPVFRLGVDAYHEMIDNGIFDEDDRVELIEGELRAMPPIKPDHAGKNNRLNRLLNRRVGDEALVTVQNPLTLPPHSEPEPDLMLLRPRDDFYERANPTPKDTLLVIEICDSSLRYDQEVKVPLYAAHGAFRRSGWWTCSIGDWRSTGARDRRIPVDSATRRHQRHLSSAVTKLAGAGQRYLVERACVGGGDPRLPLRFILGEVATSASAVVGLIPTTAGVAS